jgi:hypothetical protein
MASSVPGTIAVVVALIGLSGVVLTSLRSNLNDQRHHAREVLLKPSEDFARAALDAMAKLRYVTPPPPQDTDELPHRNERLLSDLDERRIRLAKCAASIDCLRQTRADVRLVFRPTSTASELARQVLEHLRDCLESAEAFYSHFERNKNDSNGWRESAMALGLIHEYKYHRQAVYRSLDEFFVNVSERLAKPHWR